MTGKLISATFLFILLLISCNKNSKPVDGIYQGIIPAASGPGIDITLTFYPDQSVWIRMIYLKGPKDVFYDYGQWSDKDGLITINPVSEDGSSWTFRKEDRGLLITDPEGKEMIKGLPQNKIYRISD